MRVSLNLLRTSMPYHQADIFVALLQNNAKTLVNAGTHTSFTDNSTGVAGSVLVNVPPVTPGSVSGTNLSPRAAFNTAIGKMNNDVAVIAASFGVLLALLAVTPAVSGGDGTVSTPYTIPALDKVLAATAGAGPAASDVLTTSAQPADTETVIVGGRTYTFQTVLTNVDGHVLRGASETAAVLNLQNAINGSGGTIGTDYAAATTPNTQVIASGAGAHGLTVTALSTGQAGNSIAATETLGSGSWASATLLGGVNGLGILWTEANAALTVQKNNFSTCVKMYNILAVAMGHATLADNTGGSASQTLALANKVTATTDQANVASRMALDTEVDAALTAFSANVATLASLTASVLLAALTTITPVILTP